MNMYSQCLWEKGSSVDINPVSVVLQQVSSEKKETLLACVCEGMGEVKEVATQSGYFTERMVEWFHSKYLKGLFEKGRETEITKSLEDELEKCMKELERYGRKHGGIKIQYSGILIRNTQCWILSNSESGIYLFNRRYNKVHARYITLQKERRVWEGRVQKNIGLLLCTCSFGEILSKEECLEVLFKQGKYDEKQMEKRLKELWREGEKRGLDKAGVVYIQTF